MQHDASATQLNDVVDSVRARWRRARLLRGAAIAVTAFVATLIGSAAILLATNYSPTAVITLRIVAIVVAVALVARFVVRPLRRRPGDQQVALYLEENEPSIEGAVVSAVEVSKGAPAGPLSIIALVQRMAVDRARAVDDGRRVDAGNLRRAAAMIGAAAVVLLVAVLSADRLRHGIRALLVPWESAEAVNPFRIDIHPGDATVAKGATVLVTARAIGFSSDGAELFMRTSDTAQWTQVLMTADSSSNFTARVLDISVPTEYLVETSGLRSRVFKLSVADLPYAKRLDLQYRYPSYTGLPVQNVDSTGDIAAPAGTIVRIRVTPTLPTQGGRIVVDGGDTLSLSPMSDGTLIAMMRVTKPGFYRVELSGARGDMLTASLSYAIDVIPDRPPTVQFIKPGRDQKVLAVDEVYTEARAQDDYGVAKLELVYSVNGSPEKSVPLSQATSRVIRDMAAGHTFMLEEFQLQPGDVVSYYAKATDNDAVAGAKSITTDIYFMQVRPYAQDYRQEQQAGGGGGGGGGGGENPGTLSKRQRDIIAGTFKTNRDSSTQLATQFTEDVATLRLAQQKLREDVMELQNNLIERGVTGSDSALANIAKILPIAAAAMDTAEALLGQNRARDAMQPEQRALQQLARAEAEFRNVRVNMGGQQQGGGGGGGGGQEPEDLADLFELRQDRMRNQYESVQRGESDSAMAQSQQIDQTAERLKQLAARAQQENERARRKADSLSRGAASGASSGDAQRQMAQEAEQAARQLERLARERESQSLAEAARKLNEAATAMRQSAANPGSQGAAQSQAAMDKLRDARRLMDQDKEATAKKSFDDAVNTGRRLAQEQKRVADDVARAANAQGAERQTLVDDVGRRKNAMADTAKALASRLDNLARESRKDQPQAAKELEEASDTLRNRHIENNLRVTSNLGRFPQNNWTGNEGVISNGIEQVNKALEEARAAAQSGSSANANERRNAEAMDKARDLVRGMESMDERARQQQEQRNGQQQGQQGQQQGGQQRGQGGQRESQQQGSNQGGANMAGGGGNWNREVRERLNDARELRRDLANRGVDVSQLDRAINNLERLGSPVTLSDPRAEKELRTQVVEGLRAFEFKLGEQFGLRSNERVLVDRTGEIPAEYRKYVEEYYRSLGRTKPK